MKPSSFLLLLVLGAAAFAAPASAWPYLDVTASEVLSVDPPRFRTTFNITYAGYGGAYDWFTISPMGVRWEPTPADSTHLFDCGASAGWTCTQYLSHSVLEFTSHGIVDGTFSIVTDRSAPCVRIDFISHLLAGTPTLDHGYTVEACLLLDAPVPARPASWGSMKSLYR